MFVFSQLFLTRYPIMAPCLSTLLCDKFELVRQVTTNLAFLVPLGIMHLLLIIFDTENKVHIAQYFPHFPHTCSGSVPLIGEIKFGPC